jgi:predicted methyltransferase
MTDDFRKALNTISDVVRNRPSPLRAFDQIFMKERDMVRQAGFIARKFRDLSVVFIGDGDSIALSVVHLWKSGCLRYHPKKLLVLDFDERIVNAINRFAARRGYSHLILAELYNVADPMPQRLLARGDAFYTNPPWGSKNDGKSVLAFLNRGIESVHDRGAGAVVIAHDPSLDWTLRVLHRTQREILENDFVVNEMGAQRHHYYLDDAPRLQSCTLMVRRIRPRGGAPISLPLTAPSFTHFYGRNQHLKHGFVSDDNYAEREPTGLIS